jgi:hypothetical protein
MQNMRWYLFIDIDVSGELPPEKTKW